MLEEQEVAETNARSGLEDQKGMNMKVRDGGGEDEPEKKVLVNNLEVNQELEYGGEAF